MRTTIILLFVAVLCATTAQAQNVPQNVKSAFAKDYPGIKNAKWENEDGEYEVNFTHKGLEQSILYRGDGTIKETETGIAANDLPHKAREYALKKGKIKEAARIVSDKETTYEAEVNGTDLLFDSEGNFLESSHADNENEG